jgi:F-type H+-transporting ATPase subunit c
MDHIGAGLAALGVFGPGIGIGILAGLSAQAIGRNPDAAGQIRGIAIILAAFAEGLGVPRSSWACSRSSSSPRSRPRRETRPWDSWPSPTASDATS